MVESDESTNNFDPEFTSADIRDVGLTEMDLDESDPSENWVSQSINGSGFVHTPNGPLGSEKDGNSKPVSPSIPLGLNGSNGVSSSNGLSQGIQIKPTKKNKSSAGTPLTNSVQANFRGFTYSGGESVVPSASHLAQLSNNEAAVEDEESADPTTEDEYDEIGKPVGRYANARRKGQLDDDMS